MISESGNPVVKTEIEALRQRGEAFLKTVKEEYWPLVSDIFNTLKSELGLNLFGEETDCLSKVQLIETARSYRPEGCNEVVVFRRREGDSYILYVSYSKDRTLLPQEHNRYVIIKANVLGKDVEAMFKDSELVVLK